MLVSMGAYAAIRQGAGPGGTLLSAAIALVLGLLSCSSRCSSTDGVAGYQVRSPPGQLELLRSLGDDETGGGLYERQVGERLWKVPEVAASLGVKFLGVEAKR